LVHLVQDLHQLVAGFGGVGALGFVHRQLVVGALPRAPDALVLALRHPAGEGGEIGVKKKSARKKIRREIKTGAENRRREREKSPREKKKKIGAKKRKKFGVKEKNHRKKEKSVVKKKKLS